MARVLLIGADGLDRRSFLSQAQAGRTPHLSGLARRGCAGWLAASAFGDGPAAWASIATGRPLQDHQVFLREEAWAGGVRPIGRASWRVAPVWARLEAAGISTGSVGWPATRPGSAWDGLHIDDEFPDPGGQDPEPWALPLGCAPKIHRETLRGLRVHAADISGDMLLPFVPDLNAVAQDRDVALPHLATALARASTVQAAAAWLMESSGSAAVFVAFSFLERIRAAFPAHAPEPFQQVAAAAWRFQDSLVGRLVELAGPEALVVVVSPGRGGAPGVLVGAGPETPTKPAFEGADLLDIAPTVLARFGLEGQDLPGRAIAALDDKRPRAPAPAVEPVAAVAADAALLAQFAEEGYRPPAGPSPEWRAQALGRLALLLAPHAPEAAAVLAARALALHRLEINALLAAALSAIETERPQDLPAIADALDTVRPAEPWGALARGAGLLLNDDVPAAAPWLVRAQQSVDVQLLLRLAGLWLRVKQPSNAEQVLQKVLRIHPSDAAAEIGLSLVAESRRDFLEAEAALRRALKADPGRWAAYVQLARLYTMTSRHREAAAAAATARRLGAPADLAPEPQGVAEGAAVT